jgi:stage IV sporulation protein A
LEKINNNIYKEISQRTGGDIYIGVVGPVRTGKSTFIKKFMENLVVPNMDTKLKKDRAVDEMPQSAAGRTIMTTEPKFVPENAIEINMGDNISFKVRLIDCVGYIVPSSLGYIEGDQPRMVMTPWYNEPIPFNMAAEIGTKKVICEHSTIGLVITTDGTISDIPREEYQEVEERVITELKELNKPFIVLLNSMLPNNEETLNLANELSIRYGVSVIPTDCSKLNEEEIKKILSGTLKEFPVKEIKINIPKWLISLEKDHWLKSCVFSAIKDSFQNISKIREIEYTTKDLVNCEYINSAKSEKVDLSNGTSKIRVNLNEDLFYKVMSEKTGLDIEDEGELLNCILELSNVKRKYEKISSAYNDVLDTGYGIVLPTKDELTLEEPKIIKQNGKYGIRLRATAPSIHMLKTLISTEVTPIVGSEKQSEELVNYLLKEFESAPEKIWESNILGKSLHELVNEGLHNKLYRMPMDAREKLKETIEKIINEGCNGLICIIL